MRRTTVLLLIPVLQVPMILLNLFVFNDWLLWICFGAFLVPYPLFVAYMINSPHSTFSPAEREELWLRVAALFTFCGRILKFPVKIYLWYLAWCAGVGESKTRFFAMRPWLWIAAIIEYCTGVAFARLRRRDPSPNAVDARRHELLLLRDTCRCSAVLMWFVSMPIVIAIATHRESKGAFLVLLVIGGLGMERAAGAAPSPTGPALPLPPPAP